MADRLEVDEDGEGDDGCGEEEGGDREVVVGLADGEGVAGEGVGVVVLNCHYLVEAASIPSLNPNTPLPLSSGI